MVPMVDRCPNYPIQLLLINYLLYQLKTNNSWLRCNETSIENDEMIKMLVICDNLFSSGAFLKRGASSVFDVKPLLLLKLLMKKWKT